MNKDYTEIEFRKGVVAGSYSYARIRGSLKTKHYAELLSAMQEITSSVPQIPTQTETELPFGKRKFPVQAGYVSG